MTAPSSWNDLPVSLAGVILLGKFKELSKIIFKRKCFRVIWLHRPSSSISNSSTDLRLYGCDPAAFVQHSNTSPETWGAGCPHSWRGWAVFLQMRKSQEKKQVHDFCWEIKPCLGRRGLTVQVYLRRVAWEIQDRSTACGSYATRGSDFSVLWDVFTCRSTYLPMLHLTTLQADALAPPEKGDCGQTAQIHLVKTC